MRLIKPLRRLVGMSDVNTRAALAVTVNPLAKGQPPGKDEAEPDFCYTVPYVHQQHINLCADSCAAMLLAFRGRGRPAGDFRPTPGGAVALRNNPRGPLSGLTTTQLLRSDPKFDSLPRPRNYRWEARKLAYYMAQFGPVIASLTRHSVVLTGLQSGYVLVHDPWRGPDLLVHLDELNKKLDWADRDCMIVLPS